jgi:uncharacterized membrane protein
MKLRPFAWVIIALNLYFFISFFKDYDPNGNSSANGLAVMVLIFWLAIMNTFLYVLFRITARRKTDGKTSLKGQLKEIEQLKSEGLITEEEYTKRRAKIIEG